MKNKMIKMAVFTAFSVAVSFTAIQGAKAETIKTNNIKAVIVAEATASDGALEAVSPEAVNASSPAITTT